MEIIYRKCAGLDVHKKKIVACVRITDESGSTQKKVKTFGTTTEELLILSDWLRS
jgi:hypothetical protein